MSKKKKVMSGKAGKKNPAKKATKKAIKPSAKKNAAKKHAKPAKVKKAAPKKAAKKPIVKASKTIKKPVAVKKAPAKKSLKASKTIPKLKNKVKKAPVKVKKAAPAKKPVAKKVIPVKKTAAKKPVVKSSPAKVVKKPVNPPISKKPEPKKPIPAPVKPVAVATAPSAFKKENGFISDKIKRTEEISSKKQLAEKKSHEVLAITNTIPVKAKNEISLSKIASISHSITNPIKKTDSYAVKPEKEPNGKFEMEFVVHSSAEMLYEFLSTPSGLSEWFCDDLNIRNGIYTFIWDDQLQQARLLKTVDLHLVRFQWVDKTDGSYFEFRIQRDDLTNDIALIITDFAESVADRESSKLLWHSQIEKLMHVIGSIF
jgi:uncharacterized protein YndB with AHSA1/START domain